MFHIINELTILTALFQQVCSEEPDFAEEHDRNVMQSIVFIAAKAGVTFGNFPFRWKKDNKVFSQPLQNLLMNPRHVVDIDGVGFSEAGQKGIDRLRHIRCKPAGCNCSDEQWMDALATMLFITSASCLNRDNHIRLFTDKRPDLLQNNNLLPDIVYDTLVSHGFI